MSHTSNEYTSAEINAQLTAPNGVVERELLRRALHVESLAKRRARADTGRLRQSITHNISGHGPHMVARVGTNIVYAQYVERGTGIYGPRHRPILPRTKSALAFTVRGTGQVVVRSVRGQRPNEFLRIALREGVRM